MRYHHLQRRKFLGFLYNFKDRGIDNVGVILIRCNISFYDFKDRVIANVDG